MARAGEKALVRLGLRQFGIVTAQDIARCAAPRLLLRRRLETGEWIRLQRGIFKLGANKPTVLELEMAAMLAPGGAVLSHLSAAARHGLDVPRSEWVHVIVPLPLRAPRLRGVRVWRARDLLPSEIVRRGPFRFTHLARTMIDLASILDTAELQAALDSALRQRRTNLEWISRVLAERGKGRRGAGALRALIDEYRDTDDVPDSVLERLALELAKAIGHKPQMHWEVLEGDWRLGEVDFAWPEVKLCVEVDGWVWHSSRESFENDRERDRALQSAGWAVLRWTYRQVKYDSESLVAEAAALYRSRAAGRKRKRGVGRELREPFAGPVP